MSWDIALLCPSCHQPELVDTHEEGGTYVLGGSCRAELNVTWNYGGHFRFPELNGKTGEEAIPVLEEAVKKLGTIGEGDYWAPTAGNAGYACSVLLEWARKHPKAVFEVT